jgi:hypothetical protein
VSSRKSSGTAPSEEIAPGLHFLHAFANVSVLRTGAGLAGHLIDWAAAASDDRAAHTARAELSERRAKEANALMTRGIFSATAKESSDRATPGRG